MLHGDQVVELSVHEKEEVEEDEVEREEGERETHTDDYADVLRLKNT